MGSPSLISLTTVAGHSREIEETFSTDDIVAAVLPQALHSSITFGDLMYCIGGVPPFSWRPDLKTKQCIRLSSLHNAPSISVPTIPFRSASFLVAALGLKSDSSHPPLQASRAPARNRKIFHHQGVPPSGATLSAVPVTRIPPNSAASHRASSASLFHQGHDSTFLKLGLQSPSISITDLLSCGAVRSGPEDAADFVSTILRGADWVLTSPFHVTISQLSNCVVKALSTHLSLFIFLIKEDVTFPLVIVTKTIEFE
ncbi:hypothetical protein YC2023_085735 [Brassica napus]